MNDKVSNVTAIEKIVRDYDMVPLSESEITSLDERAAAMFVKAAAGSEMIQKGTLDALAKGALNPEQLLEIQRVVSDYNINISLITAIARKTVGAMETVLRS